MKNASVSPYCDTHQWVPRDEGDGNWSVVRIGLAPSTEPTGTEVSADERPATLDALARRVGRSSRPGPPAANEPIVGSP